MLKNDKGEGVNFFSIKEKVGRDNVCVCVCDKF